MPLAGQRQRGIAAAGAPGEEGKRLPLLGDDDRTADRAYARQFLLDEFRDYAKGHDFEYAERFQYIGPPEDRNAMVEDYVAKERREDLSYPH